MLKSPDSTYAVNVCFVAGVHGTIVKVLVPGEVWIVFGGTPIGIISKTANNSFYQVHLVKLGVGVKKCMVERYALV